MQHRTSPFTDKRIHFVGVGGCGMRALAGALINHGAVVSGSDMQHSEHLDILEHQGAHCWVGHDPNRLPESIDCAVISAAVKNDNPELRHLQRAAVPVYKYAYMLGQLMDQYRGIAVSGTHGKSTTTAMTAFVLRQAGLDPSFVVGADVPQLRGASGIGSGRHFVAEACEYDRSFLNLRPVLAAILNLEEDHLDYYADLDEIVDAFEQFVKQIRPDGTAIINGCDPNIARFAHRITVPIETVTFDRNGDWSAQNLALTDGCYQFDIVHHGQPFGHCQLALPGKHNVANAIVTAALAHHCHVPADQICHALAQFHGATRRLTFKGCASGVTILDDYAHHPTEIRASLAATRQRYAPNRLWCIFQPHQHSRTRFLLNDFADSFTDADRVVVPDIYFVRDSESDRHSINADDLVAQIKQRGRTASYLPNFDQIADTLETQLAPGDLVITMGAGDIWKISDELIRRLGKRTH